MPSPFAKYLQPDAQEPEPASSYYASDTLQLQIPQFMYGGPPTLAPGGGAEVLSAGMFSNGAAASSWFTNNGFNTPKFAQQSFFASPEYDPRSASSSSRAPFEFEDDRQRQAPVPESYSLNASAQLPLSTRELFTLGASGFAAPSPLGLPVYSTSGFDLLSILARVATRPHPKVVLGPVDLTCSFVVTDVRRYDNPIVYCSPTFCRLTGYDEYEVLGKNCRFLQAPNGIVQKGEQRTFTSPQAVSHLKKSLVADKECQTSIMNYRKDGSAFINLVTVIPITGGVTNSANEENEVVYHVGFQVDLTEQPSAILQKLRDGSYSVNYSSNLMPPAATPRDRKSHALPQTHISKDLRAMLTDPVFTQSLPLTHSTTVLVPPTDKSETQEVHSLLHLTLLENSPDFIHVVSLKGSFLYVAPSVRGILGYEPDELVGKSIAEFSHPADVVPLMRELKESSAMPGSSLANRDEAPASAYALPARDHTAPRTVDLLFRARCKTGAFVWVECRGRLHVEPGKGRKAIVLSGRARAMSMFPWEGVVRAGGLTCHVGDEDNKEFWGMVSLKGTLLMVGAGITGMLGWDADETVGTPMRHLFMDEYSNGGLENELADVGDGPKQLFCRMKRRDGGFVDVRVVLYHSKDHISTAAIPAQLIYQIKALTAPSTHVMQPHAVNLFEELETSRGSSWQYELQQLKFANKRLIDEIKSLETGVPQVITTTTIAATTTHYEYPVPQRDWNATQQQHYGPSTGLKRSWDSIS